MVFHQLPWAERHNASMQVRNATSVPRHLRIRSLLIWLEEAREVAMVAFSASNEHGSRQDWRAGSHLTKIGNHECRIHKRQG